MSQVENDDGKKRRIVGWLCVLLFVALNLFMLVVAIAYAHALYQLNTLANGDFASVASGAYVGITVFLGVWILGALITGALAYITRGREAARS